MSAPLRLVSAIGLLGPVVGGGQMINARQHVAELLAVGDDTADRDAAKANAVVAAFAADETRARTLSPCLVVAESNFEGGIDRFRTGIGEKGIIEIAGCQ